MNSKKTKHKTRGKSSKTTQETQGGGTNIIDNFEVKSESLNINDTRVQEIVSDCFTAEENDPVENDIPKKPKRNKGKKKKELLEDDSKMKEETNETTKEDKIISENTEKCIEDNVQIAPCLRKKKKRANKQAENVNENIEYSDRSEVKFTGSESLKSETDERVLVGAQGKSENKEDSTSKKKKKKKRHDSEASEKCDPCTLAFQKLIQSPNETQTIKGDIVSKEKDDTQEVLLLNSTTINSEKIKFKQLAIKKETAKDKINVPEVPISSHNVEISMADIKSISKSDILTIGSSEIEENIRDTSPKPCAKIVKPVQKKRKNKSDCETIKCDYNLEISETKLPKESEKTKVIEKESTTNNEDKKDIIFATPKTLSSDNDINETSHSKTNQYESSQHVQLNEPSSFVEVKTSKAKKKRNKNVTKSESIETKLSETEKEINLQNVDHKNTENVTEINSEQIETQKIIFPDLIEYPRSTSQQNVDSNNNTFVQEMTPTDELQLGIPINISTPIIQGSGESPEAKSIINDVIGINVTEIVTPHSSNNNEILLKSEKRQSSDKTDIKSKMIEVNRDMEELRRSIEKSLAELTATDKSDSELDKQFNELFQRQSTEPISTELMKPKNNDSEITVKVYEKNYDVHKLETESKKSETLELSLKGEDIKHEHKELEVNDSLLNKNMGFPIASDDSETKKPAGEVQEAPPVCPARRDKGKNKSKKKGKQTAVPASTNTSLVAATQ